MAYRYNSYSSSISNHHSSDRRHLDSFNRYDGSHSYDEMNGFTPVASTRTNYTTLDPYSLIREHEFNSTDERLRQLAGGDEKEDAVYLRKLEDLLSSTMYVGVPMEPTNVYGHIYLGTQANAENFDLLRRLRITHVLNCAGLPASLRRSRSNRYSGTIVQYDELPMDDGETDEIKSFFPRAHAFIERASYGSGGVDRGKILIHCTGVSRSGAVVLSYLMKRGMRLLQAARLMKNERRVVLCHNYFMQQLVEYARDLGMLDEDIANIRTPKYGRALDRPRILSSHLPLI